MEFLYLLEKLRNPVLDAFFSVITYLGSEVFFMALAIIVFWCVSKKRGYYLLAVGFFGTLLNQFLKLMCRVPRPWVKDPGFTIVEAARADATGYSFPSGHTQSAMASLGSVARFTEKKWLRWVCIVLTALVALSRMYLGVHTPADVAVSLVLGTILLFALYPIFEKSDDNPESLCVTILVLVAVSFAYVLFVENHAWPSDMDAENLAHGIKNGYLLFGCGAAMLICFFVERKYIRFEVKAPWWAQILKVVFGLGLIMAIRFGLKPLTTAIFGDHQIGTAIRYFFMVVFAVVLWPLTFSWFSQGCPLRKKQ